jgi:hypothetical protein
MINAHEQASGSVMTQQSHAPNFLPKDNPSSQHQSVHQQSQEFLSKDSLGNIPQQVSSHDSVFGAGLSMQAQVQNYVKQDNFAPVQHSQQPSFIAHDTLTQVQATTNSNEGGAGGAIPMHTPASNFQESLQQMITSRDGSSGGSMNFHPQTQNFLSSDSTGQSKSTINHTSVQQFCAQNSINPLLNGQENISSGSINSLPPAPAFLTQDNVHHMINPAGNSDNLNVKGQNYENTGQTQQWISHEQQRAVQQIKEIEKNLAQQSPIPRLANTSPAQDIVPSNKSSSSDPMLFQRLPPQTPSFVGVSTALGISPASSLPSSYENGSTPQLGMFPGSIPGSGRVSEQLVSVHGTPILGPTFLDQSISSTSTTGLDHILFDTLEQHIQEVNQAVHATRARKAKPSPFPAAKEKPRVKRKSKGKQSESPPKKQKNSVQFNDWTAEENDLLEESVEILGENFIAIAKKFANRSVGECRNQWKLIKPKEGRWDEYEDRLMRASIQRVEEEEDAMDPPIVTSRTVFWNKVAQGTPGRSGRQCMTRYNETLDPIVRKGKWSATEEALLKKGVKEIGQSWVKIAATIPGRTQRQCRTRWLTLTKTDKSLLEYVKKK